MGKKRKVEPKVGAAKVEEMSPPVEKKKKESGNVTPRHQPYADSDCESGTFCSWSSSGLGVTFVSELHDLPLHCSACVPKRCRTNIGKAFTNLEGETLLKFNSDPFV